MTNMVRIKLSEYFRVNTEQYWKLNQPANMVTLLNIFHQGNSNKHPKHAFFVQK